jgi:hypothetical protein
VQQAAARGDRGAVLSVLGSSRLGTRSRQQLRLRTHTLLHGASSTAAISSRAGGGVGGRLNEAAAVDSAGSGGFYKDDGA